MVFRMTENEMKSLLSFGSCSGKSYGTVDRRYLGSNLVTTQFIQYTVKPGKYTEYKYMYLSVFIMKNGIFI